MNTSSRTGDTAAQPQIPRTGCALALLCMVAASGCASVSTDEVEARLQSMAFQPNMYVVQAGDTPETVAFRYQLTTQELTSLNPGMGKLLRAGERINVRPGTDLSPELRSGGFVAVTGAGSTPSAQRATTVREVTVAAPVTPPAPHVSEIVITEASYDPVTGGHPNEEVIVDELDLVSPSTGYTPVPVVTAGAASAGNSWVWPTAGQVARGYAPESIGGQGVDIAGVPGQDVRAAATGTVVYSGKDPSGSGGSLVILRHTDGLMTTYSHADKLFVTEDDIVQAGDPIASLGWNEASESVLSFEVRKDGAPLDPMSFVSVR